MAKVTNTERIATLESNIANINDTLNALVNMMSTMNTPTQKAHASVDNTPTRKPNITCKMNLVWCDEEHTVKLVAINSNKVPKDLWSANYEFLKAEYNARWNKSKGAIAWANNKVDDYYAAKNGFKAIEELNIEATIELYNKYIADAHALIEKQQKIIEEYTAKLAEINK